MHVAQNLLGYQNRLDNIWQRLDAVYRRYVRNLVWEPYLQQVTDRGIVIQWATQHGNQTGVRVTPASGQGDGINVTATSRKIAELDIQHHRARVTGLRPETCYNYEIFLDGQNLLPGEELTFQTAPGSGSNSPFTFLAFGDFGSGVAAQKRLRNQMLTDNFDFILTTGDNSQGQGTYQQYDRSVLQTYRRILRYTPIFTTLGNHDYLTDQATPCLDIFDSAPRVNGALKRYYSFDYGNTHISVVDSTPLVKTADPATQQEMLIWLAHDLEQTNQTWKLVACHHPPYNTGHHGCNQRIQTYLVPIFEQYGVDLVLSGHQHNYQRTHPLLEGEIALTGAGGIVYIVSGAGARAGHPAPETDWLAFSLGGLNTGLYNRVSVDDSKLTVEAVDENGLVQDRYVLTKIPGL